MHEAYSRRDVRISASTGISKFNCLCIYVRNFQKQLSRRVGQGSKVWRWTEQPPWAFSKALGCMMGPAASEDFGTPTSTTKVFMRDSQNNSHHSNSPSTISDFSKAWALNFSTTNKNSLSISCVYVCKVRFQLFFRTTSPEQGFNVVSFFFQIVWMSNMFVPYNGSGEREGDWIGAHTFRCKSKQCNSWNWSKKFNLNNFWNLKVLDHSLVLEL